MTASGSGSQRQRLRVLSIIGTRPEAIKMGPVIRELRRHAAVDSLVAVTGQHKELLGAALRLFDIDPDFNLDVMLPDQQLGALTARLLERLDPVLVGSRPDWVLVQGDTTTAFAGALAAFYRRVAVGHVEAGLRSGDVDRPFPEEINRRLADALARAWFAPTIRARDQLLAEGVPPQAVHLTGNTIVDAVLEVSSKYPAPGPALQRLPDKRLVLMTTHRRESFGAGLRQIARAVRRLASAHPDVHVVCPVHPNPNVVSALEAELGGVPNCSLVEPLDYPDLLYVMRHAALVLTDSGGLQEEAPTFRVPVLVLREVTERPEGVSAGFARLVGVNEDRIVSEAAAVLAGSWRVSDGPNPYGDGGASARIARVLLDTLSLEREAEREARA